VIVHYQIRLLFVVGICFASMVACSQNQLVLLKRGNVIARFNEGETMKFKMRDKSVLEGVAIRFTDVSVITLGDTVDFAAIEKINVKGRRKSTTLNKVGTVLMIAGIGYFVIDQVNTLLFVEGQSGIDQDVVKASIALTATGAALKYIRSPYQKLRGISLRRVDSSSRYYKYD
jgi:hypothetical protein